MLELLELYLSSFLFHTKRARNLPKKDCVIDGFQAVMVMLALDFSEKLTKYIRPSIKLRLQHFLYIDPTGICGNIQSSCKSLTIVFTIYMPYYLDNTRERRSSESLHLHTEL